MKKLLFLALLLAGSFSSFAQGSLLVKAPGYFVGGTYVVQVSPQRMKINHRAFMQNDSTTAVLSVRKGDVHHETVFGLADGRLVRVFLDANLVLVSNGMKTLIYQECTFDVLN